MKLASLTAVAAIALTTAIGRTAPVPSAQQRRVAANVSGLAERNSDTLSEVEVLNQRHGETQDLHTRGTLDLFEFGSKARGDAGDLGPESLPSGMTGVNLDANRINQLAGLSAPRRQLLTNQLRRATVHAPAGGVNNVLPTTSQPALHVVQGSLGSRFVTAPDGRHWMLPEHVVTRLGKKYVQSPHRLFNERALGSPVQPTLQMHIKPNPKSLQLQSMRPPTRVHATQRVDTIDISSSSTESETLVNSRKRPSSSSFEAASSAANAKDKGKSIMTDPYSTKQKMTSKPIQAIPWFHPFAQTSHRLDSAAKPITATVSGGKELDTDLRLAAPGMTHHLVPSSSVKPTHALMAVKDLDTELRLAQPDTEIGLAPPTPVKPNERTMLDPEQTTWLQKDDLAPPSAKKQRQN